MTEPCANEKCPHYPCTVKEFYSDGVIAMPHNLHGWYFKCASYFSKYNFKPDPNIGCYYIPDKQFGVSGVSTLESCPICGGDAYNAKLSDGWRTDIPLNLLL